MRILQHPVPEPLLIHIGDVTVSFALLENQIQSLIWSLLSDQRTGQIVTAELSFRNLRGLLVSLYLERFGNNNSDYDAFRELNKRAGNLEAQRNIVTHSLWVAGKTANVVTRVKTTAKEKHGLKFDWETVDEERLKKLAEEIKVLASDFQIFELKLRGVDIKP